ncbi:MAG: hypothetical protein ACOC0O_06180, partial [Spirochaetota bacterium]
QTLLYPETNAELERQVVIAEDGGIKEFRNWLTYYDREEVCALLERAGFTVEVENAYLSDREYGFPAGDLGFVARKPG